MKPPDHIKKNQEVKGMDNCSDVSRFDTVELYDEFLDWMQTCNHVVVTTHVENSNGTNSKPIIRSNTNKLNNMTFPSSYPPTTSSPLFTNLAKFYSFNHQSGKFVPRDNIATTEEDSKKPDSELSLEPKLSGDLEPDFDCEAFMNYQIDVPLDLTPDFEPELDNISILSYEEDEPENPIAPGLFPSMDINDSEQFMTLDQLPLRPSYIAP